MESQRHNGDSLNRGSIPNQSRPLPSSADAGAIRDILKGIVPPEKLGALYNRLDSLISSLARLNKSNGSIHDLARVRKIEGEIGELKAAIQRRQPVVERAMRDAFAQAQQNPCMRTYATLEAAMDEGENLRDSGLYYELRGQLHKLPTLPELRLPDTNVTSTTTVPEVSVDSGAKAPIKPEQSDIVSKPTSGPSQAVYGRYSFDAEEE